MRRDHSIVEKRQAIVFPKSWLQTVCQLPDKQLADVFRMAYVYTQDGIIPEELEDVDLVVRLMFENFRISEDGNYAKYCDTCKRNKENAVAKKKRDAKVNQIINTLGASVGIESEEMEGHDKT